ncbi:MAG: hypothetical protein ACTMKW_11595, partial [Brevibacterium aurantiacum]
QRPPELRRIGQQPTTGLKRTASTTSGRGRSFILRVLAGLTVMVGHSGGVLIGRGERADADFVPLFAWSDIFILG